MKRLLKLGLVLGIIASLGLILAACGDDDDDDSAEETVAATELVLTGESTTLTLDAATAGVLEDNSVTVAPVEPATAGDDGISFPITGGTIDSETLGGTIEHSGGLVFSAGGTDLEVTDFVIDTTAGSLVATAGGDQIPLLAVDLTGLEQSDDGGVIVLEGITTSLTPEAADALNTTFDVELFEEGLAIGDVTVRATAG
jgi:hypothetical protein